MIGLFSALGVLFAMVVGYFAMGFLLLFSVLLSAGFLLKGIISLYDQRHEVAQLPSADSRKNEFEIKEYSLVDAEVSEANVVEHLHHGRQSA